MAQSDGPPRTRTSDTEREEVATILRAAVTEGRLNLAEGDERLAKAYAAVYRDELGPLTADLPGGGRQALFSTPEAVAGIKRRLRVHGLGVVAVGAALVGLWVLSGAHFFWPLIPLLFLTFSYLRHRRFARFIRGGGWAGRGWHPGGGTGGGWDGGGWRGGPPGGGRRGPWSNGPTGPGEWGSVPTGAGPGGAGRCR